MSRPRAAPARRRARIWTLGVSVLVVLGVGTWVLPQVEAWRWRRDARLAFGALLACMHGGGGDHLPTAQTTGPTEARDVQSDLRRRVLAASAAADAADRWPGRCAPHLLALEVALRSLQRQVAPPCDGLRCCPDDSRCHRFAAAGALCAALRAELALGELGPVTLDAVADATRACGVDAAASPNGPSPPEPAELIDRAEAVPIARGTRQLATDPATSESLALLLHGGRGSPRVCRVALGRRPTATCHDVGPLLGRDPAPLLLAREQEAPVQLLVQRGPDTTELVDAEAGGVVTSLEGVPLGGYVWADGTIAAVARDDGAERLVVWRGGGPAVAVREPVELPDHLVMGPAVAADSLVWVEDEGGELVLLARPLRARGSLLGQRVRVGTIGPVDPQRAIESCRSGATSAVVLTGPPEGLERVATVAFAQDGRWSPPVRAVVPAPHFGLACFDGTVRLGWTDTISEQRHARIAAPAVSGRYAVGRLRCAASGCVDERADLELERHSASSRWIFADAGSQVSVLWRSPLGDVRHRTAPLAELEQAAERPLFDDEPHGGFAWELGAGDTIVRGGVTLVLARTSPELDDGAALIALRPDGSASVIAER